jgi:hypothetical protein
VQGALIMTIALIIVQAITTIVTMVIALLAHPPIKTAVSPISVPTMSSKTILSNAPTA